MATLKALAIYPNRGCLKVYRIEQDVDYEGALISETSGDNPFLAGYQPFITEDGLNYLVPEDFDSMSEPIKVSELTEGNLATIIANADDVEMLLSYNGESLKFNFGDLISFMKSYILTSKHQVTMSGVTGQSNSLISRDILDATLNEQDIVILSAVPVSGEQGIYVDTATGDYEVYNLGDTNGAKLKNKLLSPFDAHGVAITVPFISYQSAVLILALPLLHVMLKVGLVTWLSLKVDTCQYEPVHLQ